MADPHFTAPARTAPAIAQLRVPMAGARAAAERLSLPEPLRSAQAADHRALWLGPDQWLLVSERATARELVERCSTALAGLLHLVVDVSASMHCVSIAGRHARTLLSMGSGIDWSGSATPPGYCTRTRLAQIPAIVHVDGTDSIDVYVDRSHRDYFERWLHRSSTDPLLRELPCLSTY
jgi:sarcosine oxidase subunit gamma